MNFENSNHSKNRSPQQISNLLPPTTSAQQQQQQHQQENGNRKTTTNANILTHPKFPLLVSSQQCEKLMTEKSILQLNHHLHHRTAVASNNNNNNNNNNNLTKSTSPPTTIDEKKPAQQKDQTGCVKDAGKIDGNNDNKIETENDQHVITATTMSTGMKPVSDTIPSVSALALEACKITEPPRFDIASVVVKDVIAKLNLVQDARAGSTLNVKNTSCLPAPQKMNKMALMLATRASGKSGGSQQQQQQLQQEERQSGHSTQEDTNKTPDPAKTALATFPSSVLRQPPEQQQQQQQQILPTSDSTAANGGLQNNQRQQDAHATTTGSSTVVVSLGRAIVAETNKNDKNSNHNNNNINDTSNNRKHRSRVELVIQDALDHLGHDGKPICTPSLQVAQLAASRSAFDAFHPHSLNPFSTTTSVAFSPHRRLPNEKGYHYKILQKLGSGTFGTCHLVAYVPKEIKPKATAPVLLERHHYHSACQQQQHGCPYLKNLQPQQQQQQVIDVHQTNNTSEGMQAGSEGEESNTSSNTKNHLLPSGNNNNSAPHQIVFTGIATAGQHEHQVTNQQYQSLAQNQTKNALHDNHNNINPFDILALTGGPSGGVSSLSCSSPFLIFDGIVYSRDQIFVCKIEEERDPEVIKMREDRIKERKIRKQQREAERRERQRLLSLLLQKREEEKRQRKLLLLQQQEQEGQSPKNGTVMLMMGGQNETVVSAGGGNSNMSPITLDIENMNRMRQQNKMRKNNNNQQQQQHSPSEESDTSVVQTLRIRSVSAEAAAGIPELRFHDHNNNTNNGTNRTSENYSCDEYVGDNEIRMSQKEERKQRNKARRYFTSAKQLQERKSNVNAVDNKSAENEKQQQYSSAKNPQDAVRRTNENENNDDFQIVVTNNTVKEQDTSSAVAAYLELDAASAARKKQRRLQRQDILLNHAQRRLHLHQRNAIRNSSLSEQQQQQQQQKQLQQGSDFHAVSELENAEKSGNHSSSLQNMNNNNTNSKMNTNTNNHNALARNQSETETVTAEALRAVGGIDVTSSSRRHSEVTTATAASATGGQRRLLTAPKSFKKLSEAEQVNFIEAANTMDDESSEEDFSSTSSSDDDDDDDDVSSDCDNDDCEKIIFSKNNNNEVIEGALNNNNNNNKNGVNTNNHHHNASTPTITMSQVSSPPVSCDAGVLDQNSNRHYRQLVNMNNIKIPSNNSIPNRDLLQQKTQHQQQQPTEKKGTSTPSATPSQSNNNNNFNYYNNNNNNPNATSTITAAATSPSRLSIEAAKERARRMQHEAFVLANIAHPCIISFVDYFARNGKRHLVIEYMDQGDLASEIRRRRDNNMRYLTQDSALFVGVQICLGLEYLHRHNFLHRDLKPANILLSKKWLAKLADFGSAIQFDADVNGEISFSGKGCSPLYQSPDQFVQSSLGSRRPYSEKADVWALGCIIYEILELHPPFSGTTIENLAKNIVFENPRPMARGEKLSPDLVALIMAMLSKDPRKRPTCKEILQTRIMMTALDLLVVRYAKAVLGAGAGGAVGTASLNNNNNNNPNGVTDTDRMWLKVLEEHRDLVFQDTVPSQTSRFKTTRRRSQERQQQAILSGTQNNNNNNTGRAGSQNSSHRLRHNESVNNTSSRMTLQIQLQPPAVPSAE